MVTGAVPPDVQQEAQCAAAADSWELGVAAVYAPERQVPQPFLVPEGQLA